MTWPVIRKIGYQYETREGNSKLWDVMVGKSFSMVVTGNAFLRGTHLIECDAANKFQLNRAKIERGEDDTVTFTR